MTDRPSAPTVKEADSTNSEFARASIALHPLSDPGKTPQISMAVLRAVKAFDRVIQENTSCSVLCIPYQLPELSLLHSLSALGRMRECDRERLTSLLFPKGRATFRDQQRILIDRDQLCQAVAAPLSRLDSRRRNANDSYVLCVNSLRGALEAGEKGRRLRELLHTDPAAQHPTSFEVMPHSSVHRNGPQLTTDEFLRRLRKYTWLKKGSNIFQDAASPASAPFFLIGIGADAADRDTLIRGGLDPARGGRKPDILLIDLSYSARRKLGEDWRKALSLLLDGLLELYLDESPPILAFTDDPLCMSVLNKGTLAEWDRWRSPKSQPNSMLLLNASNEFFSEKAVQAENTPKVVADTFGSDLHQILEEGFQLRRKLAEDGSTKAADVVATACHTLRKLMTLPGQPADYFTFLREEYEGYLLKIKGELYDHALARAHLTEVVEDGLAGRYHSDVVQFAASFDKLVSTIDKGNPGKKWFDDCTRKLSRMKGNSVVVVPNYTYLQFVRWRVERDPFLFEVRMSLDKQLFFTTITESEDIFEQVKRRDEKIACLVLLEPAFGVMIKCICRTQIPDRLTIHSTISQAGQLARQVRFVAQFSGAQPIADRLNAILAGLERAITGQKSNISNLDLVPRSHNRFVLDFTVGSNRDVGVRTRRIVLSSGLSLKVFESSEIAVCEEDTLTRFRKQAASSIAPGDNICIFSVDLMDAARRLLKRSIDAPEILAQYHRTVRDNAANLPGTTLSERVASLRVRMQELEPTLELPSKEAMRDWINVAELLQMPRGEVRPQAPQTYAMYMIFMKAIGVLELLAEQFWLLGIQFTRSERIKEGSQLHQTIMSIIVDPYGTISRIGNVEEGEIWKLRDLADDHVETVVANQEEEDE